MIFDKTKELVFTREDKSNICGIDKNIMNLVGLINSKRDYYTTSSCSGRIGILERIEEKKGLRWIYKSHDPVRVADLAGFVVPCGSQRWFRQEPLILHVCARNIDSAKTMINIANLAGFKRAGIINLGKRIIIEIKNDNIINAIVSEGEFVADHVQLEKLVCEANKKLVSNFSRIKGLEEGIRLGIIS